MFINNLLPCKCLKSEMISYISLHFHKASSCAIHIRTKSLLTFKFTFIHIGNDSHILYQIFSFISLYLGFSATESAPIFTGWAKMNNVELINITN